MPPQPNSVARCVATLPDGSTIEYADWMPTHIRQERFASVLAANPIAFAVHTTDGAVFAVDLVTGALTCNGQRFETEPQPTPLRLIYYKRMMASASTGPLLKPSDRENATRVPECQFIAVGWQTTTLEGRNLRAGIKIHPNDARWEITEDV